MMKSRKPLLTALATGALIFTGALIAQDVPPATSSAPAPATSAPMPPGQPAAPSEPMPPPTSEPAQPGQPMPSPMPAAPSAPATPATSAAPMPTPAPGEPMPAGSSTSATSGSASEGNSNGSQGQVVFRSVPPPAPDVGPAPDFAQLSGGRKSITEQQAVAYPPLANDFINADRNRDGKISKTEYNNWTKQL